MDVQKISEDYQYALDSACLVEMIDTNGIVLHANDNFCQISGFPKEELTGKKSTLLNAANHGQRFVDDILNTLRSGKTWKGEITNLTKSGMPYWVFAVIAPIRDSSGSTTKYMAMCYDITERKNAEENSILVKEILELRIAEKTDQLMKTQAELDRFLDSVSEVFFSFNLQQPQPISISSSCFKLFGYTKEEFESQPDIYFKLIHPDDLEKMMEYHKGTLLKGEHSFFIFRVIKKSGEVRWVEWRLIPTLDLQGNLVKCDGLCWDITDHENTQQKVAAAIHALELSEDKFKKIFQSSLESMMIFDLDGNIVDANNTCCVGLGYSREEILKLNRSHITLPDDPNVEAAFRARNEKGQYTGFIKVKNSSGALVDSEISLSLVDDSSGKKLVFVCARDVSERLKAQQELINSEKRFRALIEHGRDVISLMDAKGDVLYRSPSYQHVLGYTVEEMANMPAYAEVDPQDTIMLQKMMSELISKPGSTVTGVWRQRHKNGQWLWMEGSGANLLHDPSVKAIVNNLRDITERKKVVDEIEALNRSVEEKINIRTLELKDANKLLESYNYSVAHDLKSPMRIIAGFAKILSESAKDKLTADDNQLLNGIISTSKKSAQLVSDLLDFSQVKQYELKAEEVDMEQLTNEVIEHIKESDITPLTRFILHPLENANGDKRLLKQVWVNLVSNAVKYSKLNPDTTVEIGNEKVDGRTIYFIKDNGVGFDNTHAEKLFEVFYRDNRNKAFEGTGIGLALVKSVIDHHGGKIWAEGLPGQGSTFRFYLPETRS